jgi:4,5-dihydroxyphthalate decarboxylase
MATASSTRLQLSLGFGGNPRSWPILDGTVSIENVDLISQDVPVGDLFWRQLRFQEFDISEMSLSSLLILTAHGDSPWLGIPIFASRGFPHTSLQVRKDAGIQGPKDLVGKRFGVFDYQQSSVVWCRGILQDEFGVSQQQIEWYMERMPETSHAGATGFQTPPGVHITQIPPEKNIGQMMIDGELDAASSSGGSNPMVDRSGVSWRSHPSLGKLFADPVAESARYYAKTGIFPFSHTVIVRQSLVEQYPWLPRNIFDAFQEAKRVAEERARAISTPYVDAGLIAPGSSQGLSADLVPYGIAANRIALETMMGYSHAQGLTPHVITPEEIYAPSLMST